MKVSDLMTMNVACIQSEAPLADAARLMWDCDCGALPVLDGEAHVVGMITDRDICMATWSRDQPPSTLRVSEAMSRDISAAAPDDSIAYIEGLMRSKQIRRVPVVDESRRLIGILSFADIVRHGSSSAGKRVMELGSDQITLTLAQICRPPVATPANV